MRTGFFLIGIVTHAMHAPALAQQEDTLYFTIQEITLTEHRNISAISGTMAQGISIDTKVMESYPKLFGYTDPMRYVQSLPGVSTNGVTKGGLYVQGGENSHNLIMLSDVPVYNPSHLTGMFSIFNQEHLPKVKFSTSTAEPFLGARLSLDHSDTIPNRLSGSVSLGLISAQGTLSAPITSRTALTVSARRSFINAVYGSVLEFDGNPLRFGFTDANFTLLHRIDDSNALDMNLFWSKDDGDCTYSGFMDVSGKWNNAIASIRWRYNGKNIRSSTTAFMTGNYIEGRINQEDTESLLSAHITQYSIKSTLSLSHKFNITADASFFDILPQSPKVSRNRQETALQDKQEAFQANLRLNRTFSIGYYLDITPSLLMTGYSEPGHYICFNADPALTVEYNLFRKGTITLESGIKHQYLAQTGMTKTGLPIEFWVASGHYFKPQKALFVTLSYDIQFLNNKYAFTLQAYGKRLYNQIEYTGFAYDLLTRPYSLEDNIILCSGYNYGVSTMLTKQAGRLTGWLSYSFGQSLREGDGQSYPKLFHSSHERRHEFNAVISYKTGAFDIGGSFVVSSGEPYTPAKNLYLISSSVIVYYDEYNSSNLPLYLRLDLSATYNLPSHRRYSHGINLSFYNATAYPDYDMGYLRIDPDEQTVRYKLAKLVIPVIPSISYFCRF